MIYTTRQSLIKFRIPLQPPQGPKLTALDKNGLLVQLVPVRGSDCMKIFMTTTNSSDNTLEQYLLKVS